MSPPLPRPSASGAPAAERGSLGAWLAFGPPAAVVGLRWVLQWLSDRSPPRPAWRIEPFVGAQDPWAWVGTLGWACAALLALALGLRVLRRRWGARMAWRAAAVLWLAACLAAAAGLLAREWNLRTLVPEPQLLQAQVLGSRFVPPSLRGTGGTLVVLALADEATPRQILIEDAAARGGAPGGRLSLQWARGRLGGRYVLGWQRE